MIDIKNESLGILNGQEVKKYILKNDTGFEVHILNLGGIINKILTHDKDGNLKNVVLGYDFFEKYIDDPSYAGAIIGPTSGRIENGKYNIDGTDFVLNINSGPHANHGGLKGLTSKVFDVKKVKYGKMSGIELKTKWNHLEGNHNGNMEFYITYLIDENSTLKVELSATTDRNSYINLTNHSYFNLAGDLSINGDRQIIEINADKYCPVKPNMIPTGEKLDVENTCFDFRKGKLIKDGIKEGSPQFEITRAYDHAFVLNREGKISHAATLTSKHSGISMDVYTSQNVLVMYTGNFLDEVKAFGNLKENPRFLGVALEAQNYQNGINIEEFDSKLTKVTSPYSEVIEYRFNNKN